MKCSDCNGTGKSKYGYNQPCTHCYGKGFVEPLTNEEYIHRASTEELVKFFCEKAAEIDCIAGNPYQEEDFKEWLKEKYTPISRGQENGFE